MQVYCANLPVREDLNQTIPGEVIKAYSQAKIVQSMLDDLENEVSSEIVFEPEDKPAKAREFWLYKDNELATWNVCNIKPMPDVPWKYQLKVREVLK